MSLFVAILASFFLAGGTTRSFGDEEIDLGGNTSTAPTTVAAPKSAPTVAPAAPAITPTPASQDIEMEDENQVFNQEAPQPTPTVFEVQGREKMKDMYEAGIKYYKENDYDVAIRYLSDAVKKNDPYTPKFYYAEAYSMLGVIYQYHVIHYGRAYRCYAAALKYEKNNSTARRHIKQVYKYRHRKD